MMAYYVRWPYSCRIFWPFPEISRVEERKGMVYLRTGRRWRFVNFPHYEVGDEGVALIKRGMEGTLDIWTEEPPKLVLYGPGGPIAREGP